MFVKRVATIARFSLVFAPLLSLALVGYGCGSSNNNNGTGTAGATGTAGVTGTAGTSASAGHGGSTGSAGTSGAKDCTVATPTSADAIIMDFNSPTAGATQTTFGNYMPGTYGGGTYIYPNAATTADQMGLANTFDGMAWHITGLVKDYAGFGIYLTSKTDASMFSGLSFDIKGTFTPTGTGDGGVPTTQATMTVVDSAHEVDSAHTAHGRMTCGTCAPTATEYDGSCAQASKIIPLTTASVTQTIHWTDLTGGKRTPSFTNESPNPALLTALAAWALPWSGPGSAQYMVDITVDNIKYISP